MSRTDRLLFLGLFHKIGFNGHANRSKPSLTLWVVITNCEGGLDVTAEEEKAYLLQLEGAAKTQGQSTPSDLNVVRADLILYHAVNRLNKISTFLSWINIGVGALLLIATIYALMHAAK